MSALKCTDIVAAVVLTGLLLASALCLAQTETAEISGRVTDATGAVVVGAEVRLQNAERGTSTTTTTNQAGIYNFLSVQPGIYNLTVRKEGFRQIDFVGLTANVQAHIDQNFQLQVGAVSESVTVTGGAQVVNTQDATVSTIVDRNFAENLPMNGRTFQTLIQLTPGVVLVRPNDFDNGQFSVNGQRASSNYWTVDGVSANVGVSPNSGQFGGNGLAGALGLVSAQGSTSGLVSVDAMQEFRIQTSTYAPEFGRTPGGQVSITTRAGTNQFHGTLFDYFRNDVLDANDWFANANHLPKPRERQNDFGGIFSGPIVQNRTFFFFSYEGLRLRLPSVAQSTVPSLSARQNAIPAIQPFLNGWPLPNPGAPDVNGISPFNASFSNPSTLDAYSLRLDHKLTDALTVFGRYNESPSSISTRGVYPALSIVFKTRITAQTYTGGATWVATPHLLNELRVNYSTTLARTQNVADDFGGAVPPSLPFPSGYSASNASFIFNIAGLNHPQLRIGKATRLLQRQFNLVDNVSWQKGTHSIKLGADLRRLSPVYDRFLYSQGAQFANIAAAEAGRLTSYNLSTGRGATFLFRNLGMFAQDTWRANPRLTLTYGLRWDVDWTPSSLDGPSVATAVNFNDLATLALAPDGTPPYKTTFGNVAPRLGIAYALSQSAGWSTILRGGFGSFYDLASSEVGNTFNSAYPFASNLSARGAAAGTFPLGARGNPISLVPPNATSGTLVAFYPHLQLPYTLQWNVAVEQGLGRSQSFSASYIGAVGHRLLQTEFMLKPNPTLAQAILVSNSANSSYNALQLQFQRRLSHGVQALASYVWSHSIDSASAGSFSNNSNTLLSRLGRNVNWGSSDFDVRHTLTAGLTYDIPTPRMNPFSRVILGGWSLQNVFQARTGTPFNVFDSSQAFVLNELATVRLDLVPGQPLYLHGSQCASAFGRVCPGGEGLNRAAFARAPLDPVTQAPAREGNVPRNFLRGLGQFQWDLGVHRDFPVRERLKLQFRAEMFNLLNHPNFGPLQGDISSSDFGLATSMLGTSLQSSSGNTGDLTSLYQIGGPRSIQLALKLAF